MEAAGLELKDLLAALEEASGVGAGLGVMQDGLEVRTFGEVSGVHAWLQWYGYA